MRMPSYVDLRPAVDAIEDQGQTGACTAFGTHEAIEVCYERIGRDVKLSPLYLFFWSRETYGSLNDDGSKVEYACRILRDRGICTEATWPYVEGNKNDQPPPAAEAEAPQYKILGWDMYQSVPTAVQDIKKFVAQGRPVVIAVNCSQGMVDSGTITNWKQTTWDLNTPLIGSHCMLVVGYDDASQRLLIQNSWGNGWGDGGFFGIPYDFLGKILTDARALKLSVPTVNAGYLDDRAEFDVLMDWAEVKYGLGKSDSGTQVFTQYIYRKYGLDYYGLDTTRQMIVHYADGVGFVDLGTADKFWGMM